MGGILARGHNPAMAPRLELFEFRYRESRTGKWVRVRYRRDLFNRGLESKVERR